MKNGRAMQGHRRVVVPLGEKSSRQKPPQQGYRVGCLCGWDGGVLPILATCRREYRRHLDYEIDCVPRRCRRCGKTKSATEMADRWSRHVCKDCYSDLGNEWAKRNPHASARHKRQHHLLMKYGITLDEAEALLATQDGRCAICREEIVDPRGWSPHVDHDHATGEVRGILCFTCNVGLGQFGDDPDRLRAAADYLEGSL